MALLDRVKLRIETDLSDPELTALVAEAQSAIVERYGPDAVDADDNRVSIAITDTRSGAIVDLARPLDVDEEFTVTERTTVDGEETELELDTNFTVANGGRTLHRAGCAAWARFTTITYFPVDDTPQREEVVIGLVQLAIERKGVNGSRVGDTSTDYADFTKERERLLASLAPRKGLTLA